MTINIEILNGKPLQEQSPIFQAWFNENCMPNITFGNGIDCEQTCTEFDEFNRPKVWLFDEVRVVADYYTQDVNYNFNQFVIYDTIQ